MLIFNIAVPLDICNIKLLKARIASALNVQVNCTYASAAVACFRSRHGNSKWNYYNNSAMNLYIQNEKGAEQFFL